MSTPPPRTVPPHLLNDFTMGGLIPVSEWYIDESKSAGEPRIYSSKEVEQLIQKARSGAQHYYGPTDDYLREALMKFPISGSSILVVGSQKPWYEAFSLAFGAAFVTVVEYQMISCDHPKLRYVTPDVLRSERMTFDAILSISSFEHDGLGRYGDPINPTADFEAMGAMNAALKSNGTFYLSVPVGKDKLVWNAHRIYGLKRLPMLLEGWNMITTFGLPDDAFERETGNDAPLQPVFVLKKTNSTS